jgi:hypothetical protein
MLDDFEAWLEDRAKTAHERDLLADADPLDSHAKDTESGDVGASHDARGVLQARRARADGDIAPSRPSS